MRLTGATPRQITLIAAVKSAVTAVLGAAAGFGLFFVLRIPRAARHGTRTAAMPVIRKQTRGQIQNTNTVKPRTIINT